MFPEPTIGGAAPFGSRHEDRNSSGEDGDRQRGLADVLTIHVAGDPLTGEMDRPPPPVVDALIEEVMLPENPDKQPEKVEPRWFWEGANVEEAIARGGQWGKADPRGIRSGIADDGDAGRSGDEGIVAPHRNWGESFMPKDLEGPGKAAGKALRALTILPKDSVDLPKDTTGGHIEELLPPCISQVEPLYDSGLQKPFQEIHVPLDPLIPGEGVAGSHGEDGQGDFGLAIDDLVEGPIPPDHQDQGGPPIEGGGEVPSITAPLGDEG